MLLGLPSPTFHILLADDDVDDIMIFKEVLNELNLPVRLTTIDNGEKLMQLLQEDEALPDVLFLDLNMPRKTGMECLKEIKSAEALKRLPVVIFSTSFKKETVDTLYESGAQFYIRKPSEFLRFRTLIHKSLVLTTELNFMQPEKEAFVLLSEELNKDEIN